MNKYHERAELHWSEGSERIIVTPSLTAKSMLFYVQEIGHFYTLSRYFTERENLNSFLVVYTAAGKGTLKYRGKTYCLAPHHIFFIDCMEYQYYETDPDELWEMVWVHFNGGTSRSYFEQFIQKGDPILKLDEHSAIPEILNQLLDLYRKKDARTELLASQAIVQLLTELLLESMNQQRDPHPGFLPEFILKAVDILEKRYREKITLQLLEQETSVSRFHLAREFKRYLGLTPNEYLMNIRITNAKEMLKYSSLSVAEIAEQVGIENVSHFIHLFKKHEDVTPLVFKKKWQRPL
jgi:AraC-like DNA-binding protein